MPENFEEALDDAVQEMTWGVLRRDAMKREVPMKFDADLLKSAALDLKAMYGDTSDTPSGLIRAVLQDIGVEAAVFLMNENLGRLTFSEVLSAARAEVLNLSLDDKSFGRISDFQYFGLEGLILYIWAIYKEFYNFLVFEDLGSVEEMAETLVEAALIGTMLLNGTLRLGVCQALVDTV